MTIFQVVLLNNLEISLNNLTNYYENFKTMNSDDIENLKEELEKLKTITQMLYEELCKDEEKIMKTIKE